VRVSYWLLGALAPACGTPGAAPPAPDAAPDSTDAAAGTDAGTDAGCARTEPDLRWDLPWPDEVEDDAAATALAMERFAGRWRLDPESCDCPASVCAGEGTRGGWEVTGYDARADGTGPFLRLVSLGWTERERDGPRGSGFEAVVYVYRKALEDVVVATRLLHDLDSPWLPLIGFRAQTESFVFDLGAERMAWRFARAPELVAALPEDGIGFLADRVGGAEPFALADDYEPLRSSDDADEVLEAARLSTVGPLPAYGLTPVLEAILVAMEDMRWPAGVRAELASVALLALRYPGTDLKVVALDRLLGRLRLDPAPDLRRQVAQGLLAALEEDALSAYACDLHSALVACAADELDDPTRAACEAARLVGTADGPCQP